MEIKAVIIQVVNEHQGIKATELVVETIEVLAANGATIMNHDEYDAALNELIQNGDIIEIEYTLPMMDYRVKSLYLPKDTVIVVSKAS